MNSQPAHANPDFAIDRVLDALRTTEPPTGLEQRIAARLAQAAEARTQPAITTPSPSYISVILNAVKDPRRSFARAKLYSATAFTLIIALTTVTILHHRTSNNTAQIASDIHTQSRVPHRRDGMIVAKVGTTPSNAAILSSLEGAGPEPPHAASPNNPTPAADGISRPPSPSAEDPETIALAETLAPSRAAPPLPLTAQEHLILAATRPGQPIQLAELDLARAPILRATAQARETATIDRFVKSLLEPFAVADALSSTTSSQPQETSSPTPAPQPTDSPSN
jgi:hypothetical protein